MKLLRYGRAGQEKPGLLDAQGNIRDLSGVIEDIAGDALAPEMLAKLAALDTDKLPQVPTGVRLGPCVGRVGKFICIGLNFTDHAAESNLPVPAEPVVFGKWTSAIIGPNDDIEIPRGAQKTDWEVELGVVIGRHGRYLAESDALSHVAGYCVIHDVSEREFQLERGGTWDKGKGCDTFGPLGPWLVTKDEIADPHALAMWLEVDGRRYQSGNSANMIFRIPAIRCVWASTAWASSGNRSMRVDCHEQTCLICAGRVAGILCRGVHSRESAPASDGHDTRCATRQRCRRRLRGAAVSISRTCAARGSRRQQQRRCDR
jgi:2,4-didehydro-3-deoxy-L-rhamnonate hydrolase